MDDGEFGDTIEEMDGFIHRGMRKNELFEIGKFYKYSWWPMPFECIDTINSSLDTEGGKRNFGIFKIRLYPPFVSDTKFQVYELDKEGRNSVVQILKSIEGKKE